jgi:hypothetical protein
VDGAVAGAVVPPPAVAGLDEAAELEDADDELDDDAQPAASATQISAAATWPIRPPVTRPRPGFQ